MQLGDSLATQSDTTKLKSKFVLFTTPIEVGVNRFVDWYLEYKSLIVQYPMWKSLLSSYQDLKISFIGLGYVGLPVVVIFKQASSTYLV